MSLWPFRRKSRRKPSRQTLADPETIRTRLLNDAAQLRTQTAGADFDAPTLRPPGKRHPSEPKKLQRRARTYSFSPGRDDTIGPRRSTRGKRVRQSSKLKDVEAGETEATRTDRYDDSEGKELDLGDEKDFQRAPTLHGKREGEYLVPRKRSSKKRRKNLDREAEIKAMSNFIPHRPATDQWTSGRPMKKDSRRAKTGFGKREGEWDRDHRSSEISLPTAGSIHSSLSSDSEHISFKVSAFEALAPRPTLRYAVSPRHVSVGNTSPSGSGPTRTATQRRKLSERDPIPEDTLHANKRIDDLADDFSAGDLRELMERDQRRREQKRSKDQQRTERRLAIKAEKQKIAEAKAIEAGEDPHQNLERGVLGRELAGLGIDPASAIVTSSKRRLSKSSQTGRLPTPDATSGDETDHLRRPKPLETFHRTDSIPVETPLTPRRPEEPLPPLPQSQSSKGRGGFLRSKKDPSGSPPLARENTEDTTYLRKGSESSISNKGALSWSSIFKWSSKGRRNSVDQRGPSSFSNTSRDSMSVQNAQLPIPAPPANFVVGRRLSSGVPRRTLSRFREDLPDFAMSSTEFATPSAEPDHIPPTIAEASPDPESHVEGMTFAVATAPTMRYDTPTSGHRSIEAMRETPSTFSRPDEYDPSPEPLQSMSLASIDSEGSWLSGRMSRGRASSGAARMHHPYSRPDTDHTLEHDHDTTEEVSIVEDEYLSRVTSPTNEHAGYNRKSTGEARPSSDEDEDDDAQWGTVREGLPTVMPGHRMKSREGLLKTYGEEDGEDDVVGETPEIIVEEPARVRSATSINLGKSHVRNFSAGSAKLLDITPRASTDAKRRSVEPKRNPN